MKRTAAKSQNNNQFYGQVRAYFHIHAHALFSSLGRLVKTPFTSIMTISVMAIAMTLAASFYLFVDNMEKLTGNLESTNQISLYLKPDVSDKESKGLANEIRKNSSIKKVDLISKKQAMDEFKTYSGFGDALSILETNPLPIVIQILPKNSLNDVLGIENLMMSFAQYSQIDFVKMDMGWVNRLHSIVQLIKRSVFLLTVLLSVAVIFITGNTIRLELQNRRDEVLIEKLVGATHSFIQRPFLYTGFWLGFISGIMAWLLVTAMALILQNPIERLSLLYKGSFEMSFLSFFDTAILLFIASFLGILGAWGVLGYQIAQIKPK
ncbi:MAG: permease-like cell division protein FtsX [Methylococcales bacterium]|nr:permease-like cell division protein FtsX [Methylococcales bacterium]